MTDTHISQEMRSAIGTVTAQRVSYPVSESDIRKWAIAVYYPGPPPARFIDPAAAEKSRYGGIVAPEEFNAFAWAAAAETTYGVADAELDGNNPGRTELALGLTPPDVHYMLNGGMSVEYGVPVRPGDVLTSTTRLAEYTERPGRLGLMLFTTSEDTVTNQNDEVVRRTRMTLIRY
jgi:acyl dehydratase